METTDNTSIKTVSPDSRGRVLLSGLVKSSDRYQVTLDGPDRIVLERVVDIPAKELWIYENPDVLEGIAKGLKQSSEGKVVQRDEDFSKYIDE